MNEWLDGWMNDLISAVRVCFFLEKIFLLFFYIAIDKAHKHDSVMDRI